MDYTRNEDKLCRVTDGVNRLIDISIDEDEDVTEPLTLGQVKDHLNITFTDNDAYLERLIKHCRAAVEKYTGLSIVEKSITIHLDNYEGGYQLPYGPIFGTPYVTDKDLEEITSPVFAGSRFQYIVSPASGNIIVSYSAGYDGNVPNDLKLAILEEIAYRNENRGDQAGTAGLSNIAKSYAKAHRRVPSIL